MPFVGADLFMGYVRHYRAVWFDGKYGSGKTALAVRVAHELVERGIVRYVLSNVECVFADKPENVVLRSGKRGALYVDAAIVLDEAGMFIKSSRDSDDYLAYLRKLNVMLLLPSVEPLPGKLARLVVERTYDWTTMGLPFWQYRLMLQTRQQQEATSFFWRNPSEIFGTYDTIGYPSDDDELKEYLRKWTAQAARGLGYNAPSQKSTFSVVPNYSSSGEGAATANADLSSVVATLGRVAESIEESAKETSLTLSLSRSGEQGKKRRKR